MWHFYYNNDVSLVVSETEMLLKEVEQMLQHVQELPAAPDEWEEEHREEINTGTKVVLTITVRSK